MPDHRVDPAARGEVVCALFLLALSLSATLGLAVVWNLWAEHTIETWVFALACVTFGGFVITVVALATGLLSREQENG